MTHLAQTLLIPTLGGLDISAFTQALGAELLTNGSFSAWTGGNPTSWTVTGESGSDPEVREVGSGQGHAGSGTGSANLYRTTSGFLFLGQAALTANTWIEVELDCSYLSGTPLNVNDPLNGFLRSYSNTGTHTLIGRTASATLQAYLAGAGDVTLDSISARMLTLHPQVDFAANGTFELHYSLPGSPKAGQTVRLWYRASDDLNYWVAYLRRNDTNTAWDARLDSVSAGTATNRIAVTGVGTPNALRAIASGSDHTLWTSADGGATWTQRGGTINNGTHAANVGLRPVYASAVTPLRLRAE